MNKKSIFIAGHSPSLEVVAFVCLVAGVATGGLFAYSFFVHDELLTAWRWLFIVATVWQVLAIVSIIRRMKALQTIGSFERAFCNVQRNNANVRTLTLALNKIGKSDTFA